MNRPTPNYPYGQVPPHIQQQGNMHGGDTHSNFLPYPPLEPANDMMDTLLFVCVLIAGLFFLSHQFLGTMKSNQDKRYNKLKKQMHTEMATYSGASNSERPTSPSLNGQDISPNDKIQHFLIDSDLSSDEEVEHLKITPDS